MNPESQNIQQVIITEPKEIRKEFTDLTWYKIIRDLLVPITIVTVSLIITNNISRNDRRMTITEIAMNKVEGDPLDRELAIEMLSLVDSKYSLKLKRIIDQHIIKRNVYDFSSSTTKVRGPAVHSLNYLYKTYPDQVISAIVGVIEDEPIKMDWAQMISITQTLSLIGPFEATIDQKEKLESLKSNPYYNDTTRNVRKYLDESLQNLKIRKP